MVDINPFGWQRRKVFGRIHSGALMSGSEAWDPTAGLGAYAGRALATVGLGALAGLIAGTASFPAALFGAKGFIMFGQGLGSYKAEQKQAEYLDHALAGTLAQKMRRDKARLSPEAQTIIGRLLDLRRTATLADVFTHVNRNPMRVRDALKKALEGKWRDAGGHVKRVTPREHSELVSLFGIAFADKWARQYLHPNIRRVNRTLGDALMRAGTDSFYQVVTRNLRAPHEQRGFWDNYIDHRRSQLGDSHKSLLHDYFSAQRAADAGYKHAFTQIALGALGVCLAGGVERVWGTSAQVRAQEAQIAQLQEIVRTHHDFLNALPDIQVKLTAPTAEAVVGVQTKVSGILGQAPTQDPSLTTFAGSHGTATHVSSSSLPADVIASRQGILVQQLRTAAETSSFVKEIEGAHLDWSTVPLLTELKKNAATLAAGDPISPAWAGLLGLLPDALRKVYHDLPLPLFKRKRRSHEGETESEVELGEGETLGESFERLGRRRRRGISPLRKEKIQRDFEDILRGRRPSRGRLGRGTPSSGAGRPERAPGAVGEEEVLGTEVEPTPEGELKERVGARGGRRGAPISRRQSRGAPLTGEEESLRTVFDLSEEEFRKLSGKHSGLFGPKALRKLGVKDWLQLGLEEFAPSRTRGFSSWPVGLYRLRPSDQEKPAEAQASGAPAPIAQPLPSHATQLAEILKSEYFSDPKLRKARQLIGKELDALTGPGGRTDVDFNYFGFKDRQHRTFEEALGDQENFDKIVAKLADPNLSADESYHLHAALLRGVLHHLGSEGGQHANEIAGTFNSLARGGHVKFTEGGLHDAQKRLGQEVNAVHNAMVDEHGTPSEEFSHGIRSISPQWVPVGSRHEVHSRLIDTAHRLALRRFGRG